MSQAAPLPGVAVLGPDESPLDPLGLERRGVAKQGRDREGRAGCGRRPGGVEPGPVGEERRPHSGHAAVAVAARAEDTARDVGVRPRVGDLEHVAVPLPRREPVQEPGSPWPRGGEVGLEPGVRGAGRRRREVLSPGEVDSRSGLGPVEVLHPEPRDLVDPGEEPAGNLGQRLEERRHGERLDVARDDGRGDRDLRDTAPVGKLAVRHPVVARDEERAGEAVSGSTRVAPRPEGHRVPPVFERQGTLSSGREAEGAEVGEVVGGDPGGRRGSARDGRDVRAVARTEAGSGAVVEDPVGEPRRRSRDPGDPDPSRRHPERAERVGELAPLALRERVPGGLAGGCPAGEPVEDAELELDGARAGRAGVDEGDVRPDLPVRPKAGNPGSGPGSRVGPGAGQEDAVGPAAGRGGDDPRGRPEPGRARRPRHPEPAGARRRAGRPDGDAEAAQPGEGVGDDPLLARRERHRRASALSFGTRQRLPVIDLEGRGRRAAVREDQIGPEARRLDQDGDDDRPGGRRVGRRFHERAVVRPPVVHDAVGGEGPARDPLDDRPALRKAGLRQDAVDLLPVSRPEAPALGHDHLPAVSGPARHGDPDGHGGAAGVPDGEVRPLGHSGSEPVDDGPAGEGDVRPGGRIREPGGAFRVGCGGGRGRPRDGREGRGLLVGTGDAERPGVGHAVPKAREDDPVPFQPRDHVGDRPLRAGPDARRDAPGGISERAPVREAEEDGEGGPVRQRQLRAIVRGPAPDVEDHRNDELDGVESKRQQDDDPDRDEEKATHRNLRQGPIEYGLGRSGPPGSPFRVVAARDSLDEKAEH